MNEYIMTLFIQFTLYGMLAVSLNFIMGYAGIFSLSHAVFYGFSAYITANIALHWTSDLFAIILLSVLANAALSFIISLPALRVRGEYFVAATLGIQVLSVTIFNEWQSFTGGNGGLTGIPPLSILGWELNSQTRILIAATVSMISVVMLSALLLKGSFGRSLKAIRDSESAVQAAGKSVAIIKALSVVVSACIAAIAGVFFVAQMSFVNTESFMLETSITLMAIVIIGGTGTLIGPLVGTAVILFLPAFLSYVISIEGVNLGTIQQIVYGSSMVLLMIFRPSGIAGKKA